MTQKNTTQSSSLLLPSSTTERFSPHYSTDTGSTVSGFSFKQWHKRMQENHLQTNRIDFSLWKWCDRGCKPCRWFDNINYDLKICKCCMKFKTFKSLVTLIMCAILTYILMFAYFKDELLPGGTIFFMFVLFVSAYIAGYVLMFAGLPLMFGNLLVGILFGNVPKEWLPAYDDELLVNVAEPLERGLLIIAIIRAGLLLDVSRIQNRVKFILRISVFPLMCEFGLLWITSRFLLKMPWEWSALQASVLCIVSLSSVTSIMEKNKKIGYGEDKHLSTVLIAASAINVVLGIFAYIVCISCLFPFGNGYDEVTFWNIVLELAIETSVGLSVGSILGLMIAFFPDKRNSEAPALRIFAVGLASFSMASILALYDMAAAGVLATLTLSLVARNMWEEIGWHEDSNPVQYFYSMVHYFGQPVALSMVGFSMRFSKTTAEHVAKSLGTILIGVTGREIICFSSTLGKLYPTTMKEKIFICIAWFSKGTFQALLALAVEFVVVETENRVLPATFHHYKEYAKTIKHTTILAILLTTPLACYVLNILTPVLLTKHERSPEESHGFF